MPGITESEIEAFRAQTWKDGEACPCCAVFTKVYKRKLNSGMARGLIWMYHKAAATEWIDCSYKSLRGDDYLFLYRSEINKVKDFWKLVEGIDQKRLTALGRAFVEGAVTVPRKAFVCHGKLIGFSEDHVDIRTALGDKFNYEELMRPAA